MNVKNIILAIPLSSIDSATFTGAYQLITPVTGLPQACTILRFVNDSNVDVTISYNGTDDHDFVQTTKDHNLNFQTNAQPNNFVSILAKGTKVYVKGSAGVGLVYIIGYYNPVGV